MWKYDTGLNKDKTLDNPSLPPRVLFFMTLYKLLSKTLPKSMLNKDMLTYIGIRVAASAYSKSIPVNKIEQIENGETIVVNDYPDSFIPKMEMVCHKYFKTLAAKMNTG